MKKHQIGILVGIAIVLIASAFVIIRGRQMMIDQNASPPSAK